MKRFTLILLVVLTGASASSIAADDDDEKSWEWRLSGYLSYMRIDDATAAAEGIDDQGGVLGLRLDYVIRKYIVVNAGLGLLIIDDAREFEVEVYSDYNPYGPEGLRTEDSDIMGWSFFAETGGRYPVALEDRLQVALLLGYEWLDAERGIAMCADCPEEDLALDAGVYLQPNVGYDWRRWRLELGYSYYLEQSGLLDTWSLSVGYTFR